MRRRGSSSEESFAVDWHPVYYKTLISATSIKQWRSECPRNEITPCGLFCNQAAGGGGGCLQAAVLLEQTVTTEWPWKGATGGAFNHSLLSPVSLLGDSLCMSQVIRNITLPPITPAVAVAMGTGDWNDRPLIVWVVHFAWAREARGSFVCASRCRGTRARTPPALSCWELLGQQPVHPERGCTLRDSFLIFRQQPASARVQPALVLFWGARTGIWICTPPWLLAEQRWLASASRRSPGCRRLPAGSTGGATLHFSEEVKY